MSDQTTHTFAGSVALSYVATRDHHAIRHISTGFTVINATGPMMSKRLHPVISYEWRNRFFIAQSFTDKLPVIFEMVPSHETELESIPAEKETR